MVILRAQHSALGISGLPRDQYVNTFYFNVDHPVEDADMDNVTTLLSAFYDADPSGSVQPIMYYMTLNEDLAPVIKFYDMGHASPRPLLGTRTYTAVRPGGASVPSLPQEVAICLSYSADPVSGVAIGSLRGRIYIGPLNTNCIGTGTSVGRPTFGLQQSIQSAAAALKFQATTLFDYQWVMWSHKLSVSHPITSAYIDDEWDTQRRRGLRSTARVVAIP